MQELNGCEGVNFPMEGIRNGYLSEKNGIYKGKGYNGVYKGLPLRKKPVSTPGVEMSSIFEFGPVGDR